MISPRKLAANRRNALKSTGPRTQEGKRVSSMNAMRHGVCASSKAAACVSSIEFEAFRADFRSKLSPLARGQEVLVDELAQLKWKLNLARVLEQNALVRLFEGKRPLLVPFICKELDILARYQQELSCTIRKRYRQLRQGRATSRRTDKTRFPETNPKSAVTSEQACECGETKATAVILAAPTRIGGAKHV